MLNPQYIDRLICCDCIEGMEKLSEECIPLTVTSPPYDSMREYGGHPFDFEGIAKELYRVTMTGGVLVWVVRDQIIKGCQSATSFRQTLHFIELGFRLHETLVMKRLGSRDCQTRRYGTPPEFAFVFSKGKPRALNCIRDKRNKTAGKRHRFHSDSTLAAKARTHTTGVWGHRTCIWEYATGYNISTKDKFAYEHSALMPEAMAEDLIISYSRPGDLVFDPMMGAATTCKMALLNDRHYLGMEIHQPYYELAVKRMRMATIKQRNRLDEFFEIRPP